MFILEFSIEKTIIKLIGFAHKGVLNVTGEISPVTLGVLKFISEKLT
jgi:hypothetical protein